MNKKSARRGIAALPIIIVVAVAIGAVAVLSATGALKFSGYVRVDKPQGSSPEVSETPTPTPTPQQAKTSAALAVESYQNANFSISYPEGWKLQESGSMVAITQAQPSAGLLIITNPVGSLAGAKLSTIADANKLVAKGQFKNANFLKEEETMLNGQNAWRYELTANNDGTDIKVVYYVLADSKNMYILIGTASVENWTKLEGTLAASLETFKLEQ
ncbi:hypothetical protein A2872_02465 [Candidatus Gottesmanbacteria bacterium RIFCSPHIGHO2_01_FULL_42_12]|uniref:PsbP C-terminal domain-containing protein n=1 Tax=Candidatus Gottesmanbacteria bacterium RIFCSPHIGHO2_01_FULL_42_12 TaxID=1798377 RepID=A0A1F5Z5L8_9BACT|nr:MAG: hypothetical protein A2872_02465 [Candidatus Gottesmanbacteria bacterium RIFCSPHIGHO2_01_FULL_42_12]